MFLHQASEIAPKYCAPAFFALCVALAAGCAEEAKTPAATPDTVGDTATSTDTAAADSAADTGSKPADTQTGTTDTAKPDIDFGVECRELLPCVAACGAAADPVACVTACGKDGTAAAKTKLAAFGTCAATNCKDAKPAAKWMGCAVDKCFDPLATCGEWSGTGTCAQATGCIARCQFSDDACRFGCLHKLAKANTANFGALVQCSAEKCYGEATAELITACIADKCAAQLGSCKGEGWGCVQLAGCKAKCPTPTPDKPNACVPTCGLLSSADGVTKDKNYLKCKEACAGALNPQDCITKDCKVDRLACFDEGGTDNCQTVYKCVVDTCKGLGGDDPCIATCVAKGSSVAKEGWVGYEGCMTLILEGPQATRASCSFPYNQTTCINAISGFCGSQHSACFKL